jgi:hypothetical protein
MNVHELKEMLLLEGCNQNSFAINEFINCPDAIDCLFFRNGQWVVFFFERGKEEAPSFTSDDESEACKYYFELIIKLKHRHIVHVSKNEISILEVEKKLASNNIETIRNNIPAYRFKNDVRYRLYVVGKDIFRARSVVGILNTNFE